MDAIRPPWSPDPRRAPRRRPGGIRTVAVAVLAVLGLLAGASNSTGPGAGPAGAAEPLEKAVLRAALLDHLDFPAGWASDSRRAAAERGFGVPQPLERECRALFDSGQAVSVRAGFARTETGPFVTTVAAAHRDPAAARRAVAAFREQAGTRCATFHDREGPKGDAATVAYEVDRPRAMEPELDRLGQGTRDSAALRYHRQLTGGSDSADSPAVAGSAIVAEVMIVRVGAHTVRVAQAGRDDAGTGSLAAIAERAVEKLELVCAGRTPTPQPRQPGTTDL